MIKQKDFTEGKYKDKILLQHKDIKQRIKNGKYKGKFFETVK